MEYKIIMVNNHPVHRFSQDLIFQLVKVMSQFGDHITAFFREFEPLFFENSNKVLNLFGYDLCICNTSFDTNWKKENEGLYLCIHGLFGQPLIWNGHYSQLKKIHPNAEIRAPHVPHQANCSIEDAARPFLNLVKDYIEKNPGKPVCLFGFSRGGQIATYIANEFKDLPVEIAVYTISGTHMGSKVISKLEDIGIADLFFHPHLIEELRYDSLSSHQIISQAEATTNCHFHFYASLTDPAIQPWDSAIPSLKNANYTVLSGYGHNGLISGVRDHQLQQAATWMKSKV